MAEEELWTVSTPSCSSYLIAYLDSSCLEKVFTKKYTRSHYILVKLWAALVTLLGESILLARPECGLSQSSPIKLDISTIVRLGLGDEFHHLTKILLANCT
jgi:hypothetical protein